MGIISYRKCMNAKIIEIDNEYNPRRKSIEAFALTL